MSTFYVTEQFTTLRKEDERIKLYKGKELLTDIPIFKIKQVVIFGEVTVTASTIRKLAENKITLCYLTKWGKFIARMEGDISKNVIVRLKQYENHIDGDEGSLRFAKSFISGKIKNSRTVLMKSNRRDDKSKGFKEAIDELKRLEKKLQNEDNLDSVRGIEGRAASVYFSVFSEMIKGNFKFDKRSKRPPKDPINAMLSFGYVLLSNEMHSAISNIGLDPHIGFLHRPRYGRTSLALDLMEEFRALFVDRLVISIVNNNIIKEDDFEEVLGEIRMSKKAIRKFLEAYELKKYDEIYHPIFGYKTTYQQCFHLQARLLSKALMKEIEYIPFLIR
ncbi:CRISPR-associated endonuclease Cas1 [Clostridium botulinum C]|uniref:CRISPR-associated endonuclease Cas1 n=1 Tax=Clostridium botulinum TaxID=1491 RepID=UPI001E60DA84|nr:CRISPR-associated endonuclease Cas1 [Clostridium botulinum]MCD3245460.1 CRISPR-associated endonuclease Cas1 [Clostridium botulinum C]MCD3261839.1 CRISPR-associated endonuclease Cas1 [Clostridium botulinum C]